MPAAEMQRLQHQALQSAQKKLQRSENPKASKEERSDELEDYDELSIDVNDWEDAGEYQKYLAQNEINVKEQEKKLSLPPKKPVKKISKEEQQKIEKQKALDDDVESVQKLYESENQKESDIYEKVKEMAPKEQQVKKDESTELIDTAEDAHSEDSEPSV